MPEIPAVAPWNYNTPVITATLSYPEIKTSIHNRFQNENVSDRDNFKDVLKPAFRRLIQEVLVGGGVVAILSDRHKKTSRLMEPRCFVGESVEPIRKT